MTRMILAAALALALAGCEDLPSSPANRPNNNAVPAPTQIPGPNDPQPKPRPFDPTIDVPPIIKSFDGQVMKKNKGSFVFRGLSGRDYLLLPTRHLTDKSPGPLKYINYDQIEVGQKLTVRLSVKVPLAPIYYCEWVVLHGVRLPDGQDLTPKHPLYDK